MFVYNFDYRQEIATTIHCSNPTLLAEVSSFEGRCICLLRVGQHSVGIVLKPLASLALAIGMLFYATFNKLIQTDAYQQDPNRFLEDLNLAAAYALNVIVSPICQSIKLMRATSGIIHPGAYLTPIDLDLDGVEIVSYTMIERENDPRMAAIRAYGQQLAGIAKSLGCCSPELISKLRKFDCVIFFKLFHEGDRKSYFKDMISRNLGILTQALSNSNFPRNKVVEIYALLEPGAERSTGICACAPGLSTLLTQMVAAINQPVDTSQVIPWLQEQYQELIFNQMLGMAREHEPHLKDPSWYKIFHKFPDEQEPIDETNALNLIILLIGKELRISSQRIDLANHDQFATSSMKKHDKEFNILKNELEAGYKETTEANPYVQFLLSRINSYKRNTPEEYPGLVTFRSDMVSMLIKNVTDYQLIAQKENIRSVLGLQPNDFDEAPEESQKLFYVKCFYFMRPKAYDPADNDLNEEGIRAVLRLQH